MAKYMILYNSDESPKDMMANASPEDMKTSMGEWIQWRDEASKKFKVEFGMPMQVVTRVSPDGTGKSDSRVSGHGTLEGGSYDDLVGLLKSHPHLKRPGASIDVFEILGMPGLDPGASR